MEREMATEQPLFRVSAKIAADGATFNRFRIEKEQN